jgi:hypothetical protein
MRNSVGAVPRPLRQESVLESLDSELPLPRRSKPILNWWMTFLMSPVVLESHLSLTRTLTLIRILTLTLILILILSLTLILTSSTRTFALALALPYDDAKMWLKWLAHFSLARRSQLPCIPSFIRSRFSTATNSEPHHHVESNTSKCTRKFPCLDHVPLDLRCTATYRAFIFSPSSRPPALRLGGDIPSPMTLLRWWCCACKRLFCVCSCSMP